MDKKVSVIIPAYNEEKNIQRVIEKYRSQNYPGLEIIVVANNSTDRTFEIAQQYADAVLDIKENIGVCKARNEGAKIATGDIFIFSDADSFLSQEAVEKIVPCILPFNVGTPLGRADNNKLTGQFFFFIKNWLHRLGIYKGIIDGVLICHKDIFNSTSGFNENIKIGEFNDFIKRAVKVGGQYRVFTQGYAVTSLRRYEEKGYIAVFFFWIAWKITSLFKKNNSLENRYFT